MKQTHKSKRERLSGQSWLETVFRLLMMKIMEVTHSFGCYTMVAMTLMLLGIGTQADA